VLCLNELQLDYQKLLWYFEGIPQAEQ
jgi:hypothetical protein